MAIATRGSIPRSTTSLDTSRHATPRRTRARVTAASRWPIASCCQPSSIGTDASLRSARMRWAHGLRDHVHSVADAGDAPRAPAIRHHDPPHAASDGEQGNLRPPVADVADRRMDVSTKSITHDRHEYHAVSLQRGHGGDHPPHEPRRARDRHLLADVGCDASRVVERRGCVVVGQHASLDRATCRCALADALCR